MKKQKIKKRKTLKGSKTSFLLIPLFILIILNLYYFLNTNKIKNIVTYDSTLKFSLNSSKELEQKIPKESLSSEDYKIENLELKNALHSEKKDSDAVTTLGGKKEKMPKQKEVKVRQNDIYFLYANEKNELALVTEKVYVNGENQLEGTLKKLLEARNSVFLNLVPEGTKLLNVYVKDNVAFIDFSEDFKYNKGGYEGVFLSLKQVVYTAMQFPNIRSVVFLIEGKKETYISEGVSLKKPFTKKSFDD